MTDPETKFRVTKVAKRPKSSTGWGESDHYDGVKGEKALHGKICATTNTTFIL